MKSISEVKCWCVSCGWLGTIGDCGPDADGEGSFGCPRCNVPIEHEIVLNRTETDFRKLVRLAAHHALNVAYNYGADDGEGRKAWTVDQMVRALLQYVPRGYDTFVDSLEKAGKTWDTGTPPDEFSPDRWPFTEEEMEALLRRAKGEEVLL